MNTKYFDTLKDIYSSSTIKTIITDEEFKVIWTNDSEIEELILQKSALCIFEFGTKIPTSSSIFSGMLDGIPYAYNVILYNNDEQKFFIIEIMSRDVISDHYNGVTFEAYYLKAAEIRQAVFEISNAALNIYDIFESTECYNEISLLNVQMRGCYKILSDFSSIPEIGKYHDNAMESKIFNLSEFISKMQTAFQKILSKSENVITFETEEDLYIEANIDSLTHALVDAILYIIHQSEKLPLINITVKKISDDIMINISNNGYYIEADGHQEYNEDYLNKYCNKSKGSSFDIEMYVIKQFCKRFNGRLYLSSGIKGQRSIGIRLPQANGKDMINQQELTTKFTEYFSNRFSPVYIALADVFGFDFF